MSEWQLIESAPKDGTSILAFVPDYWFRSRMPPYAKWQCCIVRWDGYDDDWSWHTLDGDTDGKPTHWMPLPEPPKEAGS